MELKPYSAETKDNFWISIGYHICKLRVDFDRIYTNIGEYNFYETGRIRQLIFYYIQPDRILSRLITHLSRVMHSLDYNNESTSHIESGDISIPIQSIFFKAAPDYTYTKLINSTKKSKTMTNEDLSFIHETFDNFEKLLTYIANEDKFKKTFVAKGQYDFTQLVKLEQIVRKLQKRIYRLKNYILEIPVR
jgi:hypothetical protein